ncbi:alpha-latrotoxin-Lh1a-like [Parasteatoda tepidariorum]|uniref:alpha-latrotoxin-Lh1a-like n=1 Tax=Parasteatoda tepidariorum TaxID=114398 RepID=UPI001C71DD47|nr:uncharacterized protein LOC122272029 [Parasteatoda tepidariorum]XP_042910941.1 uncharacterized protein LOC122272029 [Parasteatoda tepidariorum]
MSIIFYLLFLSTLPIFSSSWENIFFNRFKRDDDVMQDLCYAVKKEHYDVISHLVLAGVEIDGDCSIGSKKYTPLIYAIEYKKMEIFKFFVNFISDVNQKDKFENTPLYYSSLFNCLECVKFLIENKGANINALNFNNYTALDAAYDENYYKIVDYLTLRGAIFTGRYSNGQTTEKKYIDSRFFIDSSSPPYNGPLVLKRNRTSYGYRRFRRNNYNPLRIDSSTALESSAKQKQKAPSVKRSISDAIYIFPEEHIQQKKLQLDQKHSNILRFLGSNNPDKNGPLLLLNILFNKFILKTKSPIIRQDASEMEIKANALLITDTIKRIMESLREPLELKDVDFSEVHSKILKELASGKEHKIPEILSELLHTKSHAIIL